MKKKYLILRSNGCNGYWSYLGPDNSKGRKESITSSFFIDRFLCVGVEEAVQFDSKEEAEIFLSGLGMVYSIFKIEEIYIIE